MEVLEVFTEEFLTLTNMLGVCVWFIADGEKKLWLVVEGNRSGEVLNIFTIEVPTLTNILEVAIVLADKIETVWFTVNGEEKLRLLADRKMGDGVLDLFIEEFPALTSMLEVAIVEKIEIICVWFIVDSKEKFGLLVEGNWSSEVLDVFTKEVPTLRNLLEVVIMLVDNFDTACVWFIVSCEEKLGLFVDGKCDGGTLDTFIEEFLTLKNLLEVTFMLVEKILGVWFTVDCFEKLLLLVEDKRTGVVLGIFTLDIVTEEFLTPTNLLEVSIMLVDKYETVCVWFTVDCEKILRLLMEDKSSGVVLEIFTLDIVTLEFPTLTNLLEVSFILVDKYETVCVWFTVDCEEKLRLPLEGDISGGVLNLFTVEFLTLKNLLEVTIMLAEKIETVWFIVDNDEKFWPLVEGTSNDEVLDIIKLETSTEGFSTLMNLLEVAIMLADKYETVCVIVDSDEKLCLLVEGRSNDRVLAMFVVGVFTKEFPTLMNLLAIMLADKFESFCVRLIVDWDEKL